jgi:hypothetical protein
MENNKTMVPALEQQAFMNQFLSMFLQFVPAWTFEPRLRPDIKFTQVCAIPEEVVQAVSDSMCEWQEISVAEHLGETAFRSAEWITFNKLFIYIV